MMRRQAFAAFGTTTLDDQPSGFGAHANTKAMRLRTTTIIGLKSSLHDLSP
jgi:hypothetical protein